MPMPRPIKPTKPPMKLTQANESIVNEAVLTNEADKTNKADEAHGVNVAEKVIDDDEAIILFDEVLDLASEAVAEEAEAIVADEAKVSVADEAEARMVDKAGVAKINEADLTDDASKVDKADKVANKAVANDAGVSIKTPLLLPFSLANYSAIFVEVKGYFEINKNQLLGFEAAIDNVRVRLNDGNELDNQLGTV